MQKKSRSDKQLVKECIFTALTLLMEKKDFKDITISEIAEKAGVSRMTYYRTYSSKEDILLQHFEEKFRKMIQILQRHPEISGYQFGCHFFSFFKEHASIIKALYKADLLKLMIQKFMEIIESLYSHFLKSPGFDRSIYYQIALKAGGLFSMLICWIETGQKESPEELARMAAPLLEA